MRFEKRRQCFFSNVGVIFMERSLFQLCQMCMFSFCIEFQKYQDVINWRCYEILLYECFQLSVFHLQIMHSDIVCGHISILGITGSSACCAPRCHPYLLRICRKLQMGLTVFQQLQLCSFLDCAKTIAILNLFPGVSNTYIQNCQNWYPWEIFLI